MSVSKRHIPGNHYHHRSTVHPHLFPSFVLSLSLHYRLWRDDSFSFLVAIHCPKLHDASWWLLAIGRWFLLLMLLWLLLLLPGFVNLDPETRNTHTHSHIYTPAHHTDIIYNSNTITNTCARPECFWQTHLEHLLHLLRRLPHFNCFCSHHTTTVASD